MPHFQFKVHGYWPFPTDMLRYDGCGPATVADAELIEKLSRPFKERPSASHGQPYEVTLRTTNAPRRFEPTYLRWRSFSWRAEQPVKVELVSHHQKHKGECDYSCFA